MLILLEGPPRAGKSYTAVKEHICPALKAGRKVYARLNGLNPTAISAELNMSVERVEQLLVRVPEGDVKQLFTAKGDDPPVFNVEAGALIVIDEIHDFYTSGRQALPKEEEAFFAKHGHIGLDVVVMTQAVNRLHSAIRARVERKTQYVKQTALGRTNKYTVRYFAVGDVMGKFEQIGSDTKEYEPQFFPMYHGFQPGVENTEAYTADSKTVWQVLKWPVIVMSVLFAAGVFFFLRFMFGGADMVIKQPEKPKTETVQTGQVFQQPVQPSGVPADPKFRAIPGPVKPVEKVFKNPGVKYLVGIAKLARPRFLGEYRGPRGLQYVVEFRAAQGQAMERLSGDQLESLGWTLKRESFGLLAEAEGEALVFTAWPVDLPYTQSSIATQRIKAAAGSPAPASSAQPIRSADGKEETSYGSFPQGIGVVIPTGTNTTATFPESEGYGCETCGDGG